MLLIDLRKMWGQCLAISAMLACGIATFVTATSTILSLDRTCERYYQRFHFADIFVPVVRAPNQLAKRIEEIPGVERVQTRVVRDVLLDVPDMVEPASCRLISLGHDPAGDINGVYLMRGRLPNPLGRNEVLASESFAEAHGWRLGDQVSVIMGGRKERLTIVGTAMSPEYIYAVQPGQMIVDNKRFGVLWMPYRQMAAAFNMEGAFNSALLELQLTANVNHVVFQIDRLTAGHGSTGAYDRSEQHSNRWVRDELHQLKGMARVTPSLFLAVAIALFNIVLSRMVHQQQEQIATLRAFGYSWRDVAGYYLKFVLVLVVLGSLVGVAGGAWLGHWMTHAYVKFFRFPLVRFVLAYDQIALAVGIASVGAVAGSYTAIRRAVRLQPAVAMRPEAPKSSGRSIPERLGLRTFLTPVARMVFRRLERNPRSTLLSVFGMSLGVAVLILGTFLEDSIAAVIDIQFERAQRQDVMIAFNENLSVSAVHDVYNLPGVTAVEPFRAVPVRIRFGPRIRRESLMALASKPGLFRVLDDKQQPVAIRGRGLTVSEKMAEMMGLVVGDKLIVELLEGRRPAHMLEVAHVFPDFTDPAIYVNRDTLHRLLGEGHRHSGVFVSVDEDRIDELYAAVKEMPAASGITVKSAALRTFNDTFRENLRPMRIINGLFGFTIAFGVIYSCALITLSERSRDLATLRVMGFTRWEVSRVLLGELAVITLAAIPVGLSLGWYFASIATAALDTETHRLPLVMTSRTFAYATLIILISAVVSSLIVRRMLDRLDLISVLKVKA